MIACIKYTSVCLLPSNPIQPFLVISLYILHLTEKDRAKYIRTLVGVLLVKVCSTVAMLIKSGERKRDELMKRQVWATVINCFVICMLIPFTYTIVVWAPLCTHTVAIATHIILDSLCNLKQQRY